MNNSGGFVLINSQFSSKISKLWIWILLHFCYSGSRIEKLKVLCGLVLIYRIILHITVCRALHIFELELGKLDFIPGSILQTLDFIRFLNFCQCGRCTK